MILLFHNHYYVVVHHYTNTSATNTFMKQEVPSYQQRVEYIERRWERGPIEIFLL